MENLIETTQPKKSCKKCKTRYKTTYKTLFHNVRIGLLKAFHIYIDVIYEQPQPKASELARRYNLTYKTAYNFKKKVIMNNGFIDLDDNLPEIFYSHSLFQIADHRHIAIVLLLFLLHQREAREV